MRINKKTSSKWILFSSLGWLLGVILTLVFSVTFDAIGIEGLQFFMAIGMGLGMGFMQWRFLNAHIKISKQWISYLAIGLTIPFLVLDIIKQFVYFQPDALLIALCISAGSIITGLLQIKLIKPYIKSSILWIALSFLGWTLAGLSIFSVDYTHHISDHNLTLFFINLSALLIGGPIVGFITRFGFK
mgnify:CR=1 FL=1